jgi:hypothetical protein
MAIFKGVEVELIGGEPHCDHDALEVMHHHCPKGLHYCPTGFIACLACGAVGNEPGEPECNKWAEF